MRTRLYADDRCIVEVFPPNELREMAWEESIDHKKEKKICNCPNCGAPVNSYICEYCGTEFEKPKKKLSDEEARESFADFARKQRLAELQASQEWQTQKLLNSLMNNNIEQEIPISKDGNVEDTPVLEADKELATVLMWFMIGMVLFTLFAIVVTWIYNLS